MRKAFLFTPLLALLLISRQHTRAAETNVITLSCDGTFTNSDTMPEPVGSMDIVVNFDERTVYFLGYLARMEVMPLYPLQLGEVHRRAFRSFPHGRLHQSRNWSRDRNNI